METAPQNENTLLAGVDCTGCGGDLSAHTPEEYCELCGQLAAASLSPELRPPHTMHSVRCLACAYDLTGLDLWGDCPECGRSIGESARRAALRDMPVELIRRVRTGLRIEFWVWNATIVLSFVMGVVLAVFIASPVLTSAAMGGLTLVAGGLTFYGWYLLTTPIAVMDHASSASKLRVWILILLGFGLFVGVASSFFNSANAPGTPPGTAPVAAGFGVAVFAEALAVVAGIVVILLQLSYLERLAEFVPDRKLQSTFKNLRTLAVVGLVLAAIGLALAAAFGIPVFGAGGVVGAGGGGALSPAMMLGMCGFGLGWLLFFVYYIISVYKLGNRAQSALGFAQDTEAHRAFDTEVPIT